MSTVKEHSLTCCLTALKYLEKSEFSRFHPALRKVTEVRLKPLWVRLCKHSPCHCFPNAPPVTAGSCHQLKATAPYSVLKLFCGALMQSSYIFLTRFWGWFGLKSLFAIPAVFRCGCKNLPQDWNGYRMTQYKEASRAPVDSSVRGYGWITLVRDGTRSTWAIASLHRSQLHRAVEWLGKTGCGRHSGDHISLSIHAG